MRKLSLLAAAAMVAGGSAFAMDGGGVSISGEANFGVKFAESDDDSKNDLQFHHEFKVTFAASGTTDGGIGFGGEMTLDNTESVTSGKVTPAKTGYIVKATDLTGPGKIAFEAKYGIPVTGLSAGDVIETGSKANLSGWGKTTNAALLARYAGTYKETSTTTTYVANSDLPVTGNLSSGGGLVQYLATMLEDDVRVQRKDAVTDIASIKVGDITIHNIKSVKFTEVSVGGDSGTGTADTDFTDGVTVEATDTITIELNDGIKYVFTYVADDANGTRTGTAAGWQFNLRPAADGVEAITADNAFYILAADQVSVTTVSATGSRLAGTEKVAASQAYIDSLSASVAASDKQKVNNHGEVYISMDMHKLTIGSDLDAADKLAGGLADPGFDGIGIDDVAEGIYGKSAKQVRYDGDFGVASVAISYGDNAGDAAWAAGFSFDVEPVTFGAGFDSNGVMSVGMGFTQGAIAMSALYSTDSDHDEADNEAFKCADVNDKAKASYNAAKSRVCMAGGNRSDGLANKPDQKNQAMGVDVSYQMNDATSVVLVAAQHKKESAHLSYVADNNGTTTAGGVPEYSWSTSSTTVDAFGVGFSHDLGGGATLKAGAGSVDSDAVADLGITMKF